MSTDDQLENDNDGWTPEERLLLAALSRERIPPHELKARTVQAVQRLNAATLTSGRSRGRVLTFAAAAAVIFMAGTLVGYLAAARATRATHEAQGGTHEAVANTKDETPNINQVRYVVWY